MFNICLSWLSSQQLLDNTEYYHTTAYTTLSACPTDRVPKQVAWSIRGGWRHMPSPQDSEAEAGRSGKQDEGIQAKSALERWLSG